MKNYPPPYQFRFQAGPYLPPQLPVGKAVKDAWAGMVVVAGMTDALIPWPAHLHLGRFLPILTGDLIRAAVEESEGVVAHYWGISKYHVDQWKRALAGTKESDVFATLAVLRYNPNFRQMAGYPS